MSGRDARDAAADRVVAESRAQWESMNLAQRDATIERISVAAGITRAEATERITKPPCPHCGSSNLDRGDAGPDVCRVCNRLSYDGVIHG